MTSEFDSALRHLLGFDLDLNGNAIGRLRDCTFDGGVESAGGRDVVVLHEDGVEEADAVVHAATDRDSVFFENTPAGRRFSSVDEVDWQVGDAIDEMSALSRDAAEPA